MTKLLQSSEPIDVLIPTYNSAQFLDQALNSVRRCIAVNRIVAVDHHSSDGTLDILLKHGAEIYYENKSLGYARQLLISKAKTRVFMMLDSDVVLEEGAWYNRALRSLGNYVNGGRQIGAVALIPSENPPHALTKYVQFWWRIVPALERDFFVTHSTLVLKDAVEGIRIPESLGAAEDIYIWLYMRSHGHATRTIRVKGIHYFSYSERKGYWMGANLRILQSLVGNEALQIVLRNVFLYPFLAFMAALFTCDFHVLEYNTRRWFGYLVGYMFPAKYHLIDRSQHS